MVVPYCEFPLALLHFTGSGHMNRSMRSKAVSQTCSSTCSGVDSGDGVMRSVVNVMFVFL